MDLRAGKSIMQKPVYLSITFGLHLPLTGNKKYVFIFVIGSHAQEHRVTITSTHAAPHKVSGRLGGGG